MHELATRALCSRAWLLQVCARGGLNAAGRGFSVWKLRATKRRVCGSCEKMEHARTLCSGSVDGGGGGAGGGHSCWSRNLRTGSGLCAMHVESAAHSLVRRKHGDSQHGPCTVWKELQLWLKQAPTWHPSWRARTSRADCKRSAQPKSLDRRNKASPKHSARTHTALSPRLHYTRTHCHRARIAACTHPPGLHNTPQVHRQSQSTNCPTYSSFRLALSPRHTPTNTASTAPHGADRVKTLRLEPRGNDAKKKTEKGSQDEEKDAGDDVRMRRNEPQRAGCIDQAVGSVSSRTAR
jgi:hypothetical protein